jgi:hypothetical protein
MNKYRNKRTDVDGFKFSSQKETTRYMGLTLLRRAGEIIHFERQKRYSLEVNGMKIAEYVADFVYVEVKSGRWIIEDVKPTFKTEKARKAYQATPAYRMFAIKKKLMLACHNIEVIEV